MLSMGVRAYADVVRFSDFKPESLEEKYGYDSNNYIGHGMGNFEESLRYERYPFWSIPTLAINLIITFVLIILILILLKKILDTKNKENNREAFIIIAIISAIAYAILSSIMIIRAIQVNIHPLAGKTIVAQPSQDVLSFIQMSLGENKNGDRLRDLMKKVKEYNKIGYYISIRTHGFESDGFSKEEIRNISNTVEPRVSSNRYQDTILELFIDEDSINKASSSDFFYVGVS